MKRNGLLLLLLPAMANAQIQDTSATVPLGEVIIQENRIELPFSQQNRNIQILDQSQIKSLPVRSLNELLSFVSGVDVRQRGPQGVQTDIIIDGSTFDQTLVLINGVKVSDPQTGHNMMNTPINLDVIDHIEILRGASARVYGINALAGAINIVTKKALNTGFTAHLFSGTSFHEDSTNGQTFTSYGIRATGSLAGKNSSHILSLSSETGNGYRYNTAFNNNKAFYDGRFATGNRNELRVTAGYVDNGFGANGYYAAPGDKESQEIVQTTLASISYKAQITDKWTLAPRIAYRHNEDDYRYIRQDLSKFRNQHSTDVLNVEINNTVTTGLGVFGLGVEGRSEKINSTNLGKRERSNMGLFGEYKFDRIHNLLVNIGTYVNYNSDFGWQIFPGFDAGYTFASQWKLFTNVGTGQRLPTYTDLFYRGPTNIGNEFLTPENSFYAEGGLKYNGARTTVTASYFLRQVDDFIDWVKTDVTDPWQPRNFQQINTNGYTLSADYRIHKSNADAPALLAALSYTYLDPKIETAENKISRYAVESLRQQLTARVNIRLHYGFTLAMAARYCERISYKDYTLIDGRLSFKKDRYNLYIDSSNIFDADYVEAGAVPMPGRWFTMGVRFTFEKP